MFFVAGDQLAARRAAAASSPTCASASSLVVYDAILCEIATPDERDRVSSRGWAFGYLGGGLLLAVNLAVVTLHDAFGHRARARRSGSACSAPALWWAAFTFIPYRGLAEPAAGRTS